MTNIKYVILAQQIILVHQESTYGEITIDIWNTYLSNKILKNVNSLAVNVEPLKKPGNISKLSANLSCHFAGQKLNLHHKLWKDNQLHRSYAVKAFRLKGKVTE
jgi:hypothetical protein